MEDLSSVYSTTPIKRLIRNHLCESDQSMQDSIYRHVERGVVWSHESEDNFNWNIFVQIVILSVEVIIITIDKLLNLDS